LGLSRSSRIDTEPHSNYPFGSVNDVGCLVEAEPLTSLKQALQHSLYCRYRSILMRPKLVKKHIFKANLKVKAFQAP